MEVLAVEVEEHLRRDRLYLAMPEVLIDELRSLPSNAETAMIVAHNPGLELLALALRRLCPLRAVRDSSVALAGQPGHHRVAVGDSRVEHFHEFIEEGQIPGRSSCRERAAIARHTRRQQEEWKRSSMLCARTSSFGAVSFDRFALSRRCSSRPRTILVRQDWTHSSNPGSADVHPHT